MWRLVRLRILGLSLLVATIKQRVVTCKVNKERQKNYDDITGNFEKIKKYRENCCWDGINSRWISVCVCLCSSLQGRVRTLANEANACGRFRLSSSAGSHWEIFRYAMIVQGLIGGILFMARSRNRLPWCARGLTATSRALVITQPCINLAELHRQRNNENTRSLKNADEM